MLDEVLSIFYLSGFIIEILNLLGKLFYSKLHKLIEAYWGIDPFVATPLNRGFVVISQ